VVVAIAPWWGCSRSARGWPRPPTCATSARPRPPTCATSARPRPPTCASDARSGRPAEAIPPGKSAHAPSNAAEPGLRDAQPSRGDSSARLDAQLVQLGGRSLRHRSLDARRTVFCASDAHRGARQHPARPRHQPAARPDRRRCLNR
jgi:hypothetical protein